MDLKWDYQGMGRYLRESAELYGAVNLAARDIATRARGIARREAYDTGEYANSVSVSAERGEDRRVGCIVEVSARHAAAIEWGNERTRGRGHHILRRAGDGAS